MIIDYDGCYPNLCSGHLKVTIDDKVFDFGKHVLSSGGEVSFDENWSEEITHGEWKWGIKDNEFPEGFPMKFKEDVLEQINEQIPYGCCGGCV